LAAIAAMDSALFERDDIEIACPAWVGRRAVAPHKNLRAASNRLLTRTRGLAIALTFCNPYWIPTSIAQTDSGSANGGALAQEETGLQEIVVTARKRKESLQDIPVDVAAISEATIDRRNITSLEGVAAATPDLTIGHASSGSGAQISIRGIGSDSTSIGIDQSVATVIDGAYSGQGRVVYEGFFDLNNVEILKGPQALFFGKNATAGVISMQTNDPGDKTEALARAQYEFYSQSATVEGIVSLPLTDTLGIRIAVRDSKMYGGYYRNYSAPFNYTTTDAATGTTSDLLSIPAAGKEPGEQEELGRITLKWKPKDIPLTATLKVNIDQNRVNNNSWNYVIYACANGYSTLNPTVPCVSNNFVVHQNNLPSSIAAVTPYADGGGLYNDFRTWNAIGTVQYDFEHMTATSVTFYDWNMNKWLCACSYQVDPIWATEQSGWHAISNESRLASHFDSPVNFLVGTYYQATNRQFDQNVLFAGSQNSAAPSGDEYVSYSKDSQTKGNTYSVFGQVSWKFLEKFELAGGVRYTDEHKNSYFVQPYVNPFLTSLFVPDQYVRANQTFENWSPESTFSFKPVEDINVYVAYKTGFKSGGLSNSGIYSALTKVPYDDFVFGPEKSHGFELGVKTVLMDHQLRFNTTVYHYAFTDLQVDFFNSPTFAYITLNAGEAISQGVETELEFAPKWLPGFSATASVNYNESNYENFIGPCYSGQSVALGCPSPTGPNGFALQNLSGKPTSVAPRWTGTLSGYYEGPISASLDYGVGVNLRYSSEYLASSLGDPLSLVHSYMTVDASARIKTSDRHWEVALLGKNLTNRQYFLGAQDGSATGSGTGTVNGITADQAGYGTLPRQLELQADYRY
jgi:iron complex outermembrane receptor protein